MDTLANMTNNIKLGPDETVPKIHNSLRANHTITSPSSKLRAINSGRLERSPSNSSTRTSLKNSSEILEKLSTDNLKSVRSHVELAESAYGVRMLAKNLAKATIQINVRAIMIVTKARDNSLVYLTREVAEWLLRQENRDITVYVDHHLEKSKRFDLPNLIDTIPRAATHLKFWNKKFALRNPENFDLVVTLGGDGTVLYVSNLFQRIVPPVMCFSLGSLGFLTNFDFKDFRDSMSNILIRGVKANLRMRFTCRVHKADGELVCEQQVLNELVVDRGPSPFVSMLELYGDGSLLTVAQADGLIVATPTGSTAYSLSAGGSLVHPVVNAISVTPICPHTLSFRPILLPDGMHVKVKVPKTSRSPAYASFDGRVRLELAKGDYVTIQASPFPFPTVISSKTEYFDSVSRNLNWNVREAQKPFTHLLSGENKRHYKRTHAHKSKKQEQEVSFDMAFGESSSSNSSGDDSCYYEEDENENENENEKMHAEEFEIDDDTESDSTIEDNHFYPAPGTGLDTPPESSYSYHNFDEKTVFAHPHATVSIKTRMEELGVSPLEDD